MLFAGAVSMWPGSCVVRSAISVQMPSKSPAAVRPAFSVRKRAGLQVVNVATLEAPPKDVLPDVDGKIKIGINGEELKEPSIRRWRQLS